MDVLFAILDTLEQSLQSLFLIATNGDLCRHVMTSISLMILGLRIDQIDPSKECPLQHCFVHHFVKSLNNTR